MKIVVFDMDGTLADSETMYTLVNREIIRKHNQQIDRQVLLDTTGVTFEEFYTLLGQHWDPQKSGREMEELFAQENWGDDFDWNDLLFPFVRYCLSHLKEEGYTCMIASSSPTDVIQRMVTQTGIGQYLDAIYSGQDCQNGKPDPEIYLKIME
ncbi:MAG: HAD family phosphatase, partial [Erysipelotrichaceae bacterium]|nr:HAD family phosphatase [Erysipelotrichaceae bacterium]